MEYQVNQFKTMSKKRYRHISLNYDVKVDDVITLSKMHGLIYFLLIFIIKMNNRANFTEIASVEVCFLKTSDMTSRQTDDVITLES